MRVLSVALCFLSFASWAWAAPKDLGSVLASKKDLTRFYELIKKYPDILLQLPNYEGVTIVAPSNKAFENIPYTALNDIWDPEDKKKTVPLLQYHILQGTVSTGALEEGPSVVRSTLLTDRRYTNVTTGQNVVINKSGDGTVVFTTSMGTRCTVTDTDISFRGGLIQIVDNLLIPPGKLGETTEAFKLPSFLGGLYAADLMPDVSERKNVTIFAPSDEAFDAVGGSLLDLDPEALSRVMGYHIVKDAVLVSSDLKNGSELSTIADGDENLSLTVRVAGNNKYINSVQIIQPDILIANGILHLISNVLNPDAAAVLPDGEAVSRPPLFPVETASGVFTSDLPCTISCPVTSTPGSPTPDVASTTSSSSLFTSTSDDAAPRCTGALVGGIFGVMGVGAGVAAFL